MIRNFSDHAANERTFLAWVRTALGIAGFGVVIPKLELLPGHFSLYAGFALVVLGSVMLMLSTFRFVVAAREIESPESFNANSVRREVMLSSLLLLAVVVFTILLWFSARQPASAAEKEPAMEPSGLVTLECPMDAAHTLTALKAALAAKDLTVFAIIDHAAGAAEAGLTLPPTTVVIFGNAKAGTKPMQVDQRLGIDLPLRFLVWTDAAGHTRLSYNDPAWIAQRFGITAEAVPAIGAMHGLVAQLATDLTRPAGKG